MVDMQSAGSRGTPSYSDSIGNAEHLLEARESVAVLGTVSW